MKQFTTPGLKDTRKILMHTYRKSAKHRGRAALEAIKDRLERSQREEKNNQASNY